MVFKISSAQAATLLDAAPPAFPKYVTQLLNLANQNAGGTRPAVVGQMSDLVAQASPTSVQEWEAFYGAQHPDAVAHAADRIAAMVENLRTALGQIDRPMIERWVRDLVVSKTFTGFAIQTAVLAALAERTGLELRPASAVDESRGIDGYLGTQPLQVKPMSYRAMEALPESYDVPVVYYEKKDSAYVIDASAVVPFLSSQQR